MSEKYVMGARLVQTVKEALNLGDRCVRRIVLDIQMTCPVTAYVEEYVDESKLANLIGELPNIRPAVIFTDRIAIEPNGTQVCIRQVRTTDEEERLACLQLLDRLKQATPAEKELIRSFLWPEEEG